MELCVRLKIEQHDIIKEQLLKTAGYHQTPIFSSIGKPGDPDNLVSCRQEQISYPQLQQTSLQLGLERYVGWFKQQERL